MIYPPQQQRPGNFQQQNNRKQGDITVEKNKDNGSRTSKDDGEYVDFEEVD